MMFLIRKFTQFQSSKQPRVSKSCRVNVDNLGVRIECDDGSRYELTIPNDIGGGCVIYLSPSGDVQIECDRKDLRRAIEKIREFSKTQ